MAYDLNVLRKNLREAEQMEKTLTTWADEALRHHDDLWQQRFQEARYAIEDLVGRLERAWLAAPKADAGAAARPERPA